LIINGAGEGNRTLVIVPLIYADARLVVELDGAQHLADANAYRRDREKDALLQEHGYYVLRFLVEDLSQHLDRVLDTVLRVLDTRLGQI
jgi:very-short-patch-repair endonuclease